MNSSSIRKDKDIAKLLMSNYDVLVHDNTKFKEVSVVFTGPKESPYENVSL